MKDLCVIILTGLVIGLGFYYSMLVPYSYIPDTEGVFMVITTSLGSVGILIPATFKVFEFFDGIINDKK